MSRPLNRMLIESSLEMKCILFFGIALSLVFLASFLMYRRVTAAQIKAQSPIIGNLWASQYLMQRHWEAFSVPQTRSPLEPVSAVPAIEGAPKASATPPGPVFQPTVSATSDQIAKDFRVSMESVTKRIRNRESEELYIPYPARPKNVKAIDYIPAKELQDEALRKRFETFLERFKPVDKENYHPEKGSERFEEFYDNESGMYEYFEEVRCDRNTLCATCHNEYRQGELMGVLYVAIPQASLKNMTEKYWAYMFGVAIISAFIAIVAVLIVIRWIVIRPMRNLRDVAESISRGELSKRAEIHTGDEFESLGEAFNRMLRHLINTQEMLRKANNDLEGKVDELAHITIQLYETNRVKSDFMATMSHELRTPLNSILGFSDVLGSISALNDKQKRYVENINTSGRSLLSMINDILDMAKMEAGRMGAQTSTFSITSIVAAQCDMAKPLVDRKNIDLQAVVEPDLPPMKQDESRLQQIINNLLSNAIKFTPEGGRIKILVRYVPAAPVQGPHVHAPVGGAVVKAKNRAMLEMKVVDTGVGISEEDQQIVFEKFRQGKSASPDGDTLKREHSGSGLGLSIVKEICKMLEGEISVETQLGIGSTFTVRLPWILEPKPRVESEMMAEIQQFAQNRVIRQGNITN